ncbi:MAG TPA: SRPBCC family protein [Solirubrobacteraceae bacterium]|jgi:hypothetical protein|nr:SRPBCC family protein [Solirubrobacteraceae bacterium]
MARVGVQRDFVADPAVTEALWHDLDRWGGWVDGFGHVVRVDGDWPHAGAVVLWDSRPGGRGRVLERAVDYRPGAGHTVEVQDERLRGRQSVGFEALQGGVSVALELDYTLAASGALASLSDLLFIRRALRDSLLRTLVRFGQVLAQEPPAAR